MPPRLTASSAAKYELRNREQRAASRATSGTGVAASAGGAVGAP
jgi:hypothetical protein